ncbi:cephalosporin hydroxylase [Hoeflea marina]|uniref:Cephalosporin hydroxylase n=1 Tax=Hoeflea marina TaxID=274592 RepID=A0A317PPQ8_9HYPH|nr:CmcI family methyltransferase [Hoeflea marina]PWW01550.1 cephalosporin hydroxylase [Hoeflea marina]
MTFEDFETVALERRRLMALDAELEGTSRAWLNTSFKHRYGYNFHWLGRPVLKYPQDLVMMQMIIHSVRPTIIVETGVAFGGSLLFLASVLNFVSPEGRVIGVEKGLLDSTREAVETGPLSHMISLLEGDSVSPDTIATIRSQIRQDDTVMVVLDSDHSKAHVLDELESYAPLVSPGSFIIVFDTFIENLDGPIEDREFGPGNSPLLAVEEFLAGNPDFGSDLSVDERLLISEAPLGYLKCLR